MDQIDQRDKTLVFCATQGHAALVRDLINQIKKSSDPNYCVRVAAEDGALGDQWLLTFQDNEKTIPTILTTSQRLSTGVDARNMRTQAFKLTSACISRNRARFRTLCDHHGRIHSPAACRTDPLSMNPNSLDRPFRFAANHRLRLAYPKRGK
jgi:hypothetical protein